LLQTIRHESKLPGSALMADQRATLDHQRSTTGLAFLCTKSIMQQADDGSVDEHPRLPPFGVPGLQRLKAPISRKKRFEAAALFFEADARLGGVAR
jgi:hypothetical protein